MKRQLGEYWDLVFMLVLGALAGALLTLHPVSRLAHMSQDAQETIFVSVASYRDDDCSRTLQSMYENATYPNRVFAGVCQQNSSDHPAEECVGPNVPWRENIRVISMNYADAKGPTFARYKCSTLYRGETYFCQIDSHTTFLKGWDVAVVEDLKRCPSFPKAVISYYPHDSVSNSQDVKTVPVLCKSKFTNENLVTFEAVTMSAPQAGDQLKPIPFLAGGWFIGSGQLLRDCPYDPSLDMLFNGEEILYSARLWTSGWDFYAPPRNYVMHFYTRKGKAKFWDDIREYRDRQKASQQKVVRLLGLDGQPPIQGYEHGMGAQRTVQQYLEFAGLDPSSRTSTSEKKFCR